ncbi:hypothetical protein NLJ89_g10182 [Agrocybe chaxingu]|uniref:Ribosome biogenesis protein NOP53 n=1 Tax=Agrocybe chaxingu TaxID=84603 RepID=A0A9W8MP62_9AGAR|nr:hypothetical protein NLJ89_g10182 [Agrocybe chaxingu]
MATSMDVPKAETKALKTVNVKGKKSASGVGAPSQHNQSSRKGKRAWRKNVNIEDVEEVLEEMRVEERVTGAALSKTADEDLFQIDLKGDDKRLVRHILPRFSTSQLTSAKILAQRSAVPAVVSRATSKRKSTVSREDKEKLLRITKRPRKGPLNSIMDPSEYAPGSGIVELSKAVKQSGTYDPWQEGSSAEEVKDGLETVEKKKPKVPTTTKTRDLIEVPAIVEPHQGTSYNPPADAHEELIIKAASMEEKRVKEAEKLAEVKKKIDAAKNTQEEDGDFIASGMKVQELGPDEEQISDSPSRSNTTSKPRKTKAKKNKATRLLAEKRALAERAQRKRLLASINDARSIRKANSRLFSAREKEREQRRLALVEKLKKQGMAGQKLGKHKVPEGEIDVQLGEDLSENLRGLKPEGNLFRDRFQSLQQRALIEPRVRVLPKKRTHRIVEYEKHAWKKFDRE